jgi:hypothetical protein
MTRARPRAQLKASRALRETVGQVEEIFEVFIF